MIGRSAFSAPSLAAFLLFAADAAAIAASTAEGAATPANRPGTAADAADVESEAVAGLLDQLTSAENEATAARLRERIEAVWMASGSVTADLLTARAGALSAAGKTAEASDLLDAAIVLAPNWASGRWARAALRLKRGAVAAAQADLDTAIRLEPRHYPALTAAAMLAADQGRPRDALALLRRAAAVDPRDRDRAAWIERLTLEVEGRDL